MKRPAKILVIRFSAMGDVMLIVPVLRSLTRAYPDADITIVTRPRFAAFFKFIPGVRVFEADVDFTYTGVLGMRALFKALMRRGDFDVVIDLHDHLRTMILRTFFRLIGKKVIVFKKGRKEKKAFARKENKVTTPLMHTVERYQQAFSKAGFDFDIGSKPFLTADEESHQRVLEWLAANQLNKREKWIGIAPFAMHRSKVWPTENYLPLLTRLRQQGAYKFFLFGGGEKEIAFFEQLRGAFPNAVQVVAGQLNLRQEIALLPYIDLMLCVDSSNMHLAALTNTPLLAIWGGTHPEVGFGPFQYGPDDVLQTSRDALPCRPCSVYGRETCHRGDFACLNSIAVDQVYSEIIRRLDS